MSILSDSYKVDSFSLKPSQESLAPKEEIESSSSKLSDVEIATKKKAQEVFWGLGENWWKNIIDGYQHKHGKYVFDEGLHGGVVEKGFFNSLQKAYKLASDRLMEKPSEGLYTDIHRSACAHFKGFETHTEISAEKTGVFRDTAVSYAMKRVCDKESDENYHDFHVLETLGSGVDLSKYDMPKLKQAETWVKGYESELPKKIERVNDSILKFSRSLGYSDPLAVVSLQLRSGTQIIHKEITREEVKKIINKLFTDFNLDMQRLSSPKDKLACIAALYQHLEWVHPFYDGCGRTNLILLNKLLVEQGFNPAILEKPYMCNFAPFQEWFTYLENGISDWKKELSKVGTITARSVKETPKADSPRSETPKTQYKMVMSHGVLYKKKLSGLELFFHNLFKKS